MGNCCCGESDAETQSINLNGEGKPYLIENKYPPYDGTLIQKVKTGGNGFGIKVFRNKNVHGGNEKQAIVQVYSYKSTPPEDGGTYVVLRFKESGMYFVSGKDDPGKLLLRKPGAFRMCKRAPKDIKSPTDRRVFLQRSHSSDVVFKSMYASQQLGTSKVITLNQDSGKAAELEDEIITDDGRPADSQRFQLFDANDEEAGEQSEESHGQEVQRRD